MKIRGKRGQVTLFVIVGLLIIGFVLILLLYLKPEIIPTRTEKPQIETCIEEELVKEAKNLTKTLGITNQKLYALYEGEYVSFLCYSDSYYQPCVVQQPFPEKIFERELNTRMKNKIQSCYDSSISDLKAKGFNVREGKIEYAVSLEPGAIVANIIAPTEVGQESVTKYSNFKIKSKSNLYDMFMIATAILDWEATYGDAETNNFNFLYPDYKTEKMRIDGGIKVYTISDKKNKIRFATRSVAWPAGYNY